MSRIVRDETCDESDEQVLKKNIGFTPRVYDMDGREQRERVYDMEGREQREPVTGTCP